MNFDDPFVRAISQAVLAALVAALAFVGGLTVVVLLDWLSTKGNGPGNEDLANIVRMLPPLAGPAISEVQNTVAILLTAVPLMVTPVCFQSRALGAEAEAPAPGPRQLNGFGKVMVVVLLVVIVMSVVAYVGIRPSTWQFRHTLEPEGGMHVQEWAKAALRASTFYLAALLGLRALK